MLIAAIILYIGGVLVSYLYGRWVTIKMFNSWTLGDRTMTIILSLASWITVLAFLFSRLVYKLVDNDKSVNW